MKERSSRATLMIFADMSNFGAISKWLGTEPSKTIPAEPARTSDQIAPNKHKWMLLSKMSDTRPLSEHIEEIVALLERRGPVPPDLAKQIHEISIVCMFSSETGQGSADLNAGLMRRLANQQVGILLDLYPPSED